MVQPRVFGDERGFFFESWSAERFAAGGIDATFVQDNQSKSQRGVLRGMHFQNPEPQGKLVRVLAGSVYDVAVDIRRASPHFGQWFGIELSADNRQMLWIPEGFAHGFVALEDETEFVYKCTRPYRPDYEQTIRWDDPTIGIDWPLGDIVPIQSAKDAVAPPLAGADVYA